MKLDRIARLLKVAKARTLVEQSRLAAVRRAQARLFAEATQLEEAARAPLDLADEIDAAALKLYAVRQRALEQGADRRRADAEALAGSRDDHDRSLRASLRREIAWRSLEGAALGAERDARNAQEEERREALAKLREREKLQKDLGRS